MANPWTKKNPLLSLWLSTANAVFGAARGQAAAAIGRQRAAAGRELARVLSGQKAGPRRKRKAR